MQAAGGVVVDPCQAADVEAAAGACDRYIGEPGFTIVDGPGKGPTLVIVLVAVRRWGEVVSDSHARPFAPFGSVRRGDGHLGCTFVVELIDGPEDGAGAMGIDEVHEWLETGDHQLFDRLLHEFPDWLTAAHTAHIVQ